jgi:four helix bundle protein
VTKAKTRAAKLPLLLPEKPFDLRERTLLLAVRILEVAARLPSAPEAYVVRQQIARAGTSIGANVEEADGAFSRMDKRRSFIIARKEARELRFWLRVIERRWPGVDISSDLTEATEIILILSAIVAKLG